ncbi:GlxA family transcriptional regulator (plasmid) [Rhizobium ruizarguesonis]|uniref:GlxA family transcriptional regulator n=1 Tax=Rhizobium ruizarguesonis TaxID=2081791 RepID=UPI001031A128|nr:GlxA family transcriptional regulator [Rhizobium ruizarguesonis]NKQ87719.1 AraC family transcriptional regulator [Rhizobium ruizarguesonis]TAT96028.1 GlxA family transcriptional regulator [Rhizobium ruizarguesonis]TAU24689.1 GlxA family transcriptional regulator [Rhizobium ruizarguesonis]TAW13606.1 GlxA family transcriptional regulator [Rhizobium ruizarguesonis]TAX69003.1 GlxA family transcriptional regulator [Rhizobium ruizarguesonis]
MRPGQHRQADDAAKSAGRLKVGFVLARSFTLSAFALFVDTLRLASDEQDRSGRVLADWQVIGSTRHLITASCGVQVAPTSDFLDPSKFDYIVVVGGLLTVENPVDQETIAFLKQADAKKVPLIGVCTGSFILAEAGLMKRHDSCVSWLHYKEFRERFPELSVRSDRLFNLDRQRGSCAGGSSSADMAALLVRKCISRDAERNALEVLQIEKARTSADIQPRRPLYDDYDDARVKAAMITMEQFVDGSMSIQKLAATVGLSRRQLERIFIDKTGMSPAKAYNRVRMERAKSILAQSKAPMIEIALDVGFENASQFTRTFKRTFGQTPSQHRAAASRAH